ncbi:MAG: hypothetical protein OXG44_01515 [Gammaproteobacteria bacterium]|nr:hypothetical protein [Gammaproteobacteria bacterium]
MSDTFSTSIPRATTRVMMGVMEQVNGQDSTAILRICSALLRSMADDDLEGLLARLEGTAGGAASEEEEIEELGKSLGL